MERRPDGNHGAARGQVRARQKPLTEASAEQSGSHQLLTHQVESSKPRSQVQRVPFTENHVSGTSPCGFGQQHAGASPFLVVTGKVTLSISPRGPAGAVGLGRRAAGEGEEGLVRVKLGETGRAGKGGWRQARREMAEAWTGGQLPSQAGRAGVSWGPGAG